MAIARRLILEHRPGGRIRISAESAITRACRTFRVHSGTIGARDALHARTRAAKCSPIFCAWRRIRDVLMQRKTIDARFLGARRPVVRGQVGVVIDRRNGSGTITDERFAIATGLRHDRRIRRNVTDSAFVQATRASLARRILTGTIGSREAFDARAATVTKVSPILTTNRSRIAEGMIRHSTGTNLARALETIIGWKIRIVRPSGDTSGAITFGLSTITNLRSVDECSGRRIVETTSSGNTGSSLTNRILPLAIGRRIATNAYAHPITHEIQIRAACRTRHDVRKFGNAIVTRFGRAFESVIRHVLIIGDQGIHTRNTLRLGAIARFVRYARCRYPIERRIFTKPRIADFGRAGILIVACRIGVAWNLSSSRAAHAADPAHAAHAAHSPGTAHSPHSGNAAATAAAR